MARKRLRLVPDSGVECFEVRTVLYFDGDGDAVIDYDIDTPDHSGGDDVPTHEALGVMLYAAIAMVLDRTEKAE